MWKKINHGGEPTKNIDKKYAIFVGRYQPYHFGHIELIKQKLNQGIPALIMVRNIEPDERNPFTTEQTVTMIKKDKSIQILPVEISEEELKKIVAERLQMPLWMKEEEWSIQSVEANVEV